MESSEVRARLADDLEGVLHAQITPSQFRAKWPIQTHAPELEGVLSNLEHYFADADIRDRDPEYRTMQDSELRKVIVMLRAASSLDELNAIQFLGGSRV